MATPSRLAPFCFTLLLALLGILASDATGADQQAGKNRGTPRVGIDTTFGDRLHEAAAAYNGERWEEVISKATSALQMKPDGKNAAILYRIRGAAYEFLGDFSRALADYSEAIPRSTLWIPTVPHFIPAAVNSRKRSTI